MQRSLLSECINRYGVDAVVNSLSKDELRVLPYCWQIQRRPEQQPPDRRLPIWMYLGGRGAGKTRSGAEWVLERISEGYKRGALIARTAADVRDVIVEGEAGILTVAPPDMRPLYEPTRRRLVWKEAIVSLPGKPAIRKGGAIATTYSGDEPDQLRGPSHDFGWADELASWKRMADAWANFLLGLRLRTQEGLEPRACITTTPRPLPLIKELFKDETVTVSVGTSYDNRENLAPSFYKQIIKRYEGTRLGQQELEAKILDDNPNALFTRENINKYRIASIEDIKGGIYAAAVGVDPAGSTTSQAADTGIVVAGQDENDEYYIIADYTCHKKPNVWARRAAYAYCYHMCDSIVGEVNYGGDMVEAVIENVRQDKAVGILYQGTDIPFNKVRASRGKKIRAEPVSMLAEQGRLHFVGSLPELEDECCTWSDDLNEPSPNRLDAMVWAVTHLMENPVPMMREIG